MSGPIVYLDTGSNTNTTQVGEDNPLPVVLAINSTGAAGTVTVPTQIINTVAAAATPEAIAADATYFRTATVIAKKAARTANTGIVYLGIGATNDTQPLPLNPGDIYTIDAPLGQKYDLNDFYIDCVTAGDGVVVIYS